MAAKEDMMSQDDTSSPNKLVPGSPEVASMGGKIDARDIHGISGSPPYGVHHHDRFTFEDGAIAVLTYPSKMSREDFEDFEDWLKIELRKITRMVGCSGSASGSTSRQG